MTRRRASTLPVSAAASMSARSVSRDGGVGQFRRGGLVNHQSEFVAAGGPRGKRSVVPWGRSFCLREGGPVKEAGVVYDRLLDDPPGTPSVVRALWGNDGVFL